MQHWSLVRLMPGAYSWNCTVCVITPHSSPSPNPPLLSSDTRRERCLGVWTEKSNNNLNNLYSCQPGKRITEHSGTATHGTVRTSLLLWLDISLWFFFPHDPNDSHISICLYCMDFPILREFKPFSRTGEPSLIGYWVLWAFHVSCLMCYLKIFACVSRVGGKTLICFFYWWNAFCNKTAFVLWPGEKANIVWCELWLLIELYFLLLCLLLIIAITVWSSETT